MRFVSLTGVGVVFFSCAAMLSFDDLFYFCISVPWNRFMYAFGSLFINLMTAIVKAVTVVVDITRLLVRSASIVMMAFEGPVSMASTFGDGTGGIISGIVTLAYLLGLLILALALYHNAFPLTSGAVSPHANDAHVQIQKCHQKALMLLCVLLWAMQVTGPDPYNSVNTLV